MYTRCPECSTCFRVTDRHLAIANGKVRCGQCQLVFNAPEHAIDDLPVSQLTSNIPTQPIEKSTPDSSPVETKTESPISSEKVDPAPIAPTAKEKLEAQSQTEEAKKEAEEIIEVEPSPDTTPEFDSSATMIEDVSTLEHLDQHEAENIKLDDASSVHDATIEIDEDENLFNDNFDMDAAIDELTQTTSEDQVDSEPAEKEEPVAEKNNTENSEDDVFKTDVYDATSATSVTDIIDEMEGQLSLNIPIPKNDDETEQYDANKEFDFLKLDNEARDDLEEKPESNKVDEFEIIEFDDDENDLSSESTHEEPSKTELEDNEDKDEFSKKEEKLFNHVDLSDFDDSYVNENIVLEEVDFENSNVQNIGQHADDHGIPIQLRSDIENLQTHSQRRLHPLLAASIIVILLLISFSQLAFFRSHELVQQIPSSRPLLEAFCETVGCHYSGPHDTKQIQLLSRDVRLHPKEKNALLISVAMINNANFSQPYPNIHIRLSDISGNVVAERIFNAKTYMGKLSNPFLLMKSKTPVHINFEVVDPGKDAINFEFTFL